MTPNELTQVKRLLAQRLLNQMPDEALGELVAEMREIAQFYHDDELIKPERVSAVTQVARPTTKITARPAVATVRRSMKQARKARPAANSVA